MKSAIVIIVLLISINCHGQIDKTIRNFPKPDCTGKISKAFFSDKDRIILYPNGKEITNSEDSLHAKFERELTAEDYNKPIEIKFPITEYENWNKLDVPIIKTISGFRYKKLTFKSENDAFMILSPTRYIISGNSQAIVDKVSSYTTPQYPVTIIKNGDFTMFARDNFEINLDEIKKENYHLKSSKFFNVEVSNAIINTDSILNILDSFVTEFCDSAHLDFPKKRIKCFIHSNPNVARLFSNHGWSDCFDFDDNYVFGTVKFDIIHTVGVDFSFVSHEAVHAIWNNINKSPNFLLNEGTAVYFSLFQNYSQDFVNNSKNIKQQFYNTVKSNLDYDFQKLITNKDNFWINPSLSYSFAGIFCKYLIRKYGLRTFKTIYVNYENADSFEKIYKKNLFQLIDEFKESIKENNAL